MRAEPERRLRLRGMRWEAEGVVSLELDDPAGGELPPWEPGAHLDLVLPSGTVRQYSLCGDPHDRTRYRVAVLRVADGRGGSREVHDALRVGMELEVRGPRNAFALEPAERYVFVAGGIGITPIVAMVREAARSGAEWTLLYGGRTRASMAFVEELEELAAGAPRAVGAVGASANGAAHAGIAGGVAGATCANGAARAGRAGGAAVASGGGRLLILPEDEHGLLDLDRALELADGGPLYCCGPAPLIDALEARCAAAGCPEALRVERFAPAAKPATDAASGGAAAGDGAGGGATFRVTLARSGVELEVGPEQSIMEAARAAGVDVPSSCEQGICGTCETRVLDGLPDHRDQLLTPEEQARGETMMVCVSRARSASLTLDL